MPRMSVEVGYFRRWLTEFHDHGQLTASSPRTSTPSALPRRPIHGSRRRRLCRRRVVQRDVGQLASPSNNITSPNNFGGQSQSLQRRADQLQRARRARADAAGRYQQRKDGAGRLRECESNARAERGLTSSLNPNCRNDPGFVTQVTGLASYMVPKVEVLMAATLRSDQGAPLRATYNAPVGTSAATPGSVGRSVASRRSRAAR